MPDVSLTRKFGFEAVNSAILLPYCSSLEKVSFRETLEITLALHFIEFTIYWLLKWSWHTSKSC